MYCGVWRGWGTSGLEPGLRGTWGPGYCSCRSRAGERARRTGKYIQAHQDQVRALSDHGGRPRGGKHWRDAGEVRAYYLVTLSSRLYAQVLRSCFPIKLRCCNVPSMILATFAPCERTTSSRLHVERRAMVGRPASVVHAYRARSRFHSGQTVGHLGPILGVRDPETPPPSPQSRPHAYAPAQPFSPLSFCAPSEHYCLAGAAGARARLSGPEAQSGASPSRLPPLIRARARLALRAKRACRHVLVVSLPCARAL
jgi:hypothetical protein